MIESEQMTIPVNSLFSIFSLFRFASMSHISWSLHILMDFHFKKNSKYNSKRFEQICVRWAIKATALNALLEDSAWSISISLPINCFFNYSKLSLTIETILFWYTKLIKFKLYSISKLSLMKRKVEVLALVAEKFGMKPLKWLIIIFENAK